MKQFRFFGLSVNYFGCGALAALMALGCSSDKTPAESPEAATAGDANAQSASANQRNDRETTVFLSAELRRLCELPDDPNEGPKFDYDEASLRPRGKNILDDVATCLKTGPLKGRNVTVIGRTDPRGPTDYNHQLGKSRADAARNYLVQQGVAENQLEVKSRGEQGAQGNDEQTWALDRRVDLEVNAQPASATTAGSGAGATAAGATGASGSASGGVTGASGATGPTSAMGATGPNGGPSTRTAGHGTGASGSPTGSPPASGAQNAGAGASGAAAAGAGTTGAGRGTTGAGATGSGSTGTGTRATGSGTTGATGSGTTGSGTRGATGSGSTGSGTTGSGSAR